MSKPEILTISLVDYLALTGRSGKEFDAVGVEHVEYLDAGSESMFPFPLRIETLEARARNLFLAKLPKGTSAVVSVQKIVNIIPGKCGYICHQGTALVSKTE